MPSLPGVRAYGATRWLHSTKALIQLSLRGKTDDQLWFTFFHKAAHVLKHGKRAVFVEGGGPTAGARDPREAEADAFACDLLIPRAEWERFCARADFGLAAMRQFLRNAWALRPALWPDGCNTSGGCRFHAAISLNAGLRSMIEVPALTP